jgi:hypothetical protein
MRGIVGFRGLDKVFPELGNADGVLGNSRIGLKPLRWDRKAILRRSTASGGTLSVCVMLCSESIN